MTDEPEVSDASVTRRRSLPPWSIAAGSPDHLVLHLLIQGSFQLTRADGVALDLDLDLGAGGLVGIVTSANDTGEGPSGMRLHCAPQRGGSGIEPCEVVSVAYPHDEHERAREGGLASWTARLPAVLHLPADQVRRDPGLPAIVRLLQAELASGSREREQVARALRAPLLAYALQCFRGARAGDHGLASPPALALDRRLARAIAAMHAEPARPWTVVELSRTAGLSRAAFARRFLAALGAPPLRYLAEWRMQLARRVLVEGDDSLAGVAAKVGYESEFAFGRAFKRHHGEAPGAFRRRMRANPARSSRTPTRAAA